MKAYYHVAITKEAIGAAIRHIEPHLEGKPIVKVTDAATNGDSKLIVMECSELDHQFNLARPGVVEVKEADANKLAAKFQPNREVVEIVPQTSKQHKTKVPAFNLSGFINAHDKNSELKREKTVRQTTKASKPSVATSSKKLK